MNNVGARAVLDACMEELQIVSSTLVGLSTSAVAPYLKKYCVIRASGSLEAAFKKVIADKIEEGSHEQIKNFIQLKVRATSKNPSMDAMELALAEFDPRWKQRFGELTGLADKPRLRNALGDLVKARNRFAHGGDTDMSIDTIIQHFSDGVKVIEFLDETVHHEYEESLEEASHEGE